MKPMQKPSRASIAEKPTQHLPLTRRDFASPLTHPSLPVQGWMLLPQRLFLGGTFVYAGLQKLTNPQFFHKATPHYIGNQIIGFAQGSPLHFLLIKIVLPHAVLFGWAIALGELAIGLGTLFGLLYRPAAFFGMVLSILFFLTASWHVSPYFYGADIVFALSWLTLLLVGPAETGFPTFDGWLQRIWCSEGVAQKDLIVRVLGVLILGMNTWSAPEPESQQKGSQQQRFAAFQRRQEKRRAFLQGIAAGGASLLGLVLAGSAMRLFGQSGATASAGAANSGSSGSGNTSAGTPIARVQDVPENSAATFTIPSTGDPGVLIHLPNQQFVAFDATCTHAGCQVGYDPGSKQLICPCHGAAFDPTNQAAVLLGPAQIPLTPVKIQVDAKSGAITLQ